MTTLAAETAPRSRVRLAFQIGNVVLWAVALAYAGLVLARFVAYDANRYLAALNAQTVWLFLPAYLIASASWCFRKFGVAAIATVVVAFHLVTVGASIGSAEAIPAAAREAPQVRVLSANIRFSNPSKERLARQLLAVDADVVLLQETTEGWLDMFRNVGFDDAYPYRVSRPRSDSRGMAVYSRFPLEDVVITQPAYRPTIAARITVRGRPVSIVNVHTVGPTEGISAHRQSVAELRDLVRSRPEPRVVAGDFNATPYNRTMHLMGDLGLDSAHERRGRGLAVTWPNGHQILPPIRLDHVLVDSTIVVLDVRELRGPGTDHRPVVADLAIM